MGAFPLRINPPQEEHPGRAVAVWIDRGTQLHGERKIFVAILQDHTVRLDNDAWMRPIRQRPLKKMHIYGALPEVLVPAVAPAVRTKAT